MSVRAPRRSNTQGAVIGVLIAVLMAIASMYTQAFAWGANNGVLLDVAFTPLAFPAPAPAWTFSLASGLLVAACVTWLIQRQGRYHRTRRRWAGYTGAALLLLAIAIQIASPHGWSLDVLTVWQRAAFFLTSSGAYIALVAILVLAEITRPPATSATARQEDQQEQIPVD